MKLITCLAGIICFCFAAAASAQSPVALTINTKLPGRTIPADFSGVSIFTGTQTHNHRGISGNLFSADNTQLITLFKNSGIRSLRLGATGSPTAATANLDPAEIDSLFAFAKATGINVIYSLHGQGGVATAQYVWTHYRPYLKCFAFDNEPDPGARYGHGTPAQNYKAYLSAWGSFVQTVIDAVPGAKFAGPDAAGRSWARKFARDEKRSGNVVLITQHTYVGGNPRKRHVTSAQQAIDQMLSPGWLTEEYAQLYTQVASPVTRDGYPYRLTESDDYVHGVDNASNSFSAALWALDYMHWWAEHGAAGVNFQNTEWLTTDTFYIDSSGNYQINPKAYAIRAFDLGSDGRVEPLAMTNTDGLNLTAYAVGTPTHLYVTIINKEHGAGARNAALTIHTDGFSPKSASILFLTAPSVGARTGVTLGGGAITNNAPWSGQWSAWNPDSNGQCVVTVPAASAAVVELSTQ